MPPPGKPGREIDSKEVPTLGQACITMIMVGTPIMLQMFLSYIQVTINYIFITAYDDPVLLGALGLGLYFYACFYVTLYIGMN
jgi:Na+-driven multidrug efflux pump